MPQVFTNSAELVAEVSRRYLEYRTYRDEGVVKTHIVPEPNSTMPEVTIDLPFRTYFIRPDCFRFEFRAKTALIELRLWQMPPIKYGTLLEYFSRTFHKTRPTTMLAWGRIAGHLRAIWRRLL
jgi:hypothetical protein